MYALHSAKFEEKLHSAIDAEKIRVRKGVDLSRDFINRHKILNLLTSAYSPSCLQLAVEVVLEASLHARGDATSSSSPLPTEEREGEKEREKERERCTATFHTGEGVCVCAHLSDDSSVFSTPKASRQMRDKAQLLCPSTPAEAFVVYSSDDVSSAVPSTPLSSLRSGKTEKEVTTSVWKFLLKHLFHMDYDIRSSVRKEEEV
jgi:hypothetical protein